MKFFTILFLLLLFPSLTSAAKIEQPQNACSADYKQLIETTGVSVFTEGFNWQMKEAYDFFQKTNNNRLALIFEPNWVYCGNDGVERYGCSLYKKDIIRLIRISIFTPRDQFKYIIAHEYAHTLGLLNENEADLWVYNFYNLK